MLEGAPAGYTCSVMILWYFSGGARVLPLRARHGRPLAPGSSVKIENFFSYFSPTTRPYYTQVFINALQVLTVLPL